MLKQVLRIVARERLDLSKLNPGTTVEIITKHSIYRVTIRRETDLSDDRTNLLNVNISSNSIRYGPDTGYGIIQRKLVKGSGCYVGENRFTSPVQSFRIL